uniref:Excisionase n=1 Tax=uncultured Elusimicrobia bacterium TaxID=699876 RepID=A0A650ELZ7_9BACT|nr:hypothetical protein Elusimicrob1349_0960 [uncultured Elusimicrobia bacterium]
MAKNKQDMPTKEITILGETYLTMSGLREQLPGRLQGSKVSLGQIIKYVKEGCPCFEYSHLTLFRPAAVKEWLESRSPKTQRKYRTRLQNLREGL